MEQKFDNFSKKEAMRMAGSPAAQQLMALLQKKDPQALQKAMAQASAGDYSQIQNTLSGLMASSEVQALLKQLRG